jgi:hypothetical protein
MDSEGGSDCDQASALSEIPFLCSAFPTEKGANCPICLIQLQWEESGRKR